MIKLKIISYKIPTNSTFLQDQQQAKITITIISKIIQILLPINKSLSQLLPILYLYLCQIIKLINIHIHTHILTILSTHKNQNNYKIQ